MRVLWSLCALVCAACGRIDFAPIGDDGGSDAPEVPLPAGFCSSSVAATPAPGSDLAIAAAHDGFIALWAEPDGGPLHSLHLGSDRMLIDAQTLGTIAAPQVGGVTDDGTEYLIATFTPPSASMSTALVYDYQVKAQNTASRDLVGRDPFASDDLRNTFAFVEGSASSLEMAYWFGNAFGTPNVGGANGVITSFATDDGPGHAHVGWSTAAGECWSGDISFGAMPTLGGYVMFAGDCHDIRAATGRLGDDQIMLVWRTTPGTIQARYPTGVTGIQREVAASGRAPKVRFDGLQFWIAYQGDDSLHFATFDAVGTIVDHAVPGRPVSDEAFEVFRSGITVYLAVLTATELVLIYPC